MVTTQPTGGWGGFDSCPGCGAGDLRAVFDGDATNFLCGSCGACWLVAMGWVRRVDPRACRGAARRAESLSEPTTRAEV
jgi:ribosomal protein S27E